MAKYKDLRSLFGDGDLRRQVEVALLDVANDVLNEDPATANHTERIAYAIKVIDTPFQEAESIVRSVLIQNKDKTVTQLKGASDAAVKAAVSAVFTQVALHR